MGISRPVRRLAVALSVFAAMMLFSIVGLGLHDGATVVEIISFSHLLKRPSIELWNMFPVAVVAFYVSFLITMLLYAGEILEEDEEYRRQKNIKSS